MGKVTLIKTASGKNKIKMSKKEWSDLGKKAGWMKQASDMPEVEYRSRELEGFLSVGYRMSQAIENRDHNLLKKAISEMDAQLKNVMDTDIKTEIRDYWQPIKTAIFENPSKVFDILENMYPDFKNNMNRILQKACREGKGHGDSSTFPERAKAWKEWEKNRL